LTRSWANNAIACSLPCWQASRREACQHRFPYFFS
jgi:hypothetical protein